MLVGFELLDFGHLVEELLRVMLYLDLALVHELGGEGEPEDTCHARITPGLSIIRLGKDIRELLEGMGLGGDLVGDLAERLAVVVVLDGRGHRVIGRGLGHLALLDAQEKPLRFLAICHAAFPPLTIKTL